MGNPKQARAILPPQVANRSAGIGLSRPLTELDIMNCYSVEYIPRITYFPTPKITPEFETTINIVYRQKGIEIVQLLLVY